MKKPTIKPRDFAFRVGCPKCEAAPFFACSMKRLNSKRRSFHAERYENARKERDKS